MRQIDRFPTTTPFQSFSLSRFPNSFPGSVRCVPQRLSRDEGTDVDCESKVVIRLPSTGVGDSFTGLCSTLGIEGVLLGVGAEALDYFNKDSLSREHVSRSVDTDGELGMNKSETCFRYLTHCIHFQAVVNSPPAEALTLGYFPYF